MAKTTKGGDYEVGYARPPQQTRFATGQSGNPSGRKKGVCNLNTELAAELSEKVTVVENGRPRKLTKGKLVAKKLVNSGIMGSIPALKAILEYGGRDQGGGALARPEPLDEDDREVMEAFLKRLGHPDDAG